MNLSESSPRIHIKNNWSDAKLAGICSGSGIYSDPYVIRDKVINGQNNGIGIHIEQSRNIYFRIENCTIYNCSSGILLSRTNKGTLILNNCSFNNDGIILFSSPVPCINNTIINNFLNNNEQYGVKLAGWCHNNNIIENRIDNNQIGINIRGDNNTISSNLMNNNEQDGIYFYSGFGNIINGNLMNGCGFFCSGITNDMLSLNKIDKTNLVNNKHLYIYINKTGLDSDDFSNGGQIILFNCNNSVISDLNLSNGSESLCLYYSNNNSITNINGSDNNRHGFEIKYSNYNNIQKNNLNRNYVGMKLSGNNNFIEDNFINSNSYTGLIIQGYYNRIKNNALRNNSRKGIQMFAHNYNSTITYNTLDGNGLFGLELRLYAESNEIADNLISNNLIGIYTTSSQFNIFYRNIFITNDVHAEDYGNNNKWDNGKLGNYWDNYIGFDGNDDGIGDTPYIIPGSSGSQDNFPLLDITNPELIINMPKNGDIYGILAPIFNVEINDPHLDKMWYSFNGGKGILFWENETIDKFEWGILPDGLISIIFYTNDTLGNIASAEINIIKDATPPSIIIITPDSNEVFEAEAPTFEITINEPNLESMWYTIDNGLTTITFSGLSGTIDQNAWNNAPEGNITLRFYAKDITGNIGFAKIIIIKKSLQKPLPPEIPGYNIFIIIGLISTISVILWKKKIKE